LGADPTTAGFLSGCDAGLTAAGAAFDFSLDFSLEEELCDADHSLKDM